MAMNPVAIIDNVDDLRALLIKCNGNVTRAALELNEDSERLRALVRRTPRLSAAIAEVMERKVDQAIDVFYEGLDSESPQHQFYSAKAVINSDAGRRRGYGSAPVGAIEIRAPFGQAHSGASLEIKWIDPPKVDLEGPVPYDDGKTIEHEREPANDPEPPDKTDEPPGGR
jgi:hypothetical protein